MATSVYALNTTSWDRALDALSPKVLLAGLARAVNRTATSARAAIVPTIARDMGLKQTAVRDRIRVESAAPTKADSLRARLFADPRRIPLIEFNATGPEPSKGQGRGVTARIQGGRGRYPQAFIATMRSGHRGVFVRKAPLVGKSRGAWSPNLPIRELRGASVVQVFQKYRSVAEAKAVEVLADNVQRELAYRLSQIRAA